MQVYELKENTPQFLLGEVRYSGQTYGDKFQKFNNQIYEAFERIARIRFSSKIADKFKLPLALLGAVLFIKNHRCLQEDYSGLEFLDNCKSKLKETPGVNLEKILDFMRGHIASTTRLERVIPGDRAGALAAELCDLMNAIGQAKGKEVENYSEEQMKKISSFFGEKIYLINYDYNKGTLSDRTLSHKCIYLLKAKELFFVLFKEKGIEQIEKGIVSHEELAAIFGVESKLQKIQGKKIETKSVIKSSSPTKSSSKISADIKSTISAQSQAAIMRLKPSALFPDNVKCTNCSKVVSQFNAIFWNYSHFCFSCVMSPKVDISFIPTSIIQKFLKNQKVESRELSLVCSECGSDTVVGNYRPWQKPKSYKCKTCLKEICVEHEKMIGQCFCHCQKCDKRTITLPQIYAKLCLACRTRFCSICSSRDKKSCKCICKECGQNKAVLHEECKPRCHSCESREVALTTCPCNRKLCGVCYFNSMQPQSMICTPTSEIK